MSCLCLCFEFNPTPKSHIDNISIDVWETVPVLQQMQHIMAPNKGLEVKAKINDIGELYDKDQDK